MPQRVFSFLIPAFFWASCISAQSNLPSPEQILEYAFDSIHVKESKLKGVLTDHGTGHVQEFTIHARLSTISLRFTEPSETYQIDLSQRPFIVRHYTSKTTSQIREKQYPISFRGSALNFADLVMPYLGWDSVSLVKEEQIKGGIKCWRLRLSHSKAVAPYSSVELWVPKETGGVARIVGYHSTGNVVKRIELRKTKGGAPQLIRIEHGPEPKAPTSITTLLEILEAD